MNEPLVQEVSIRVYHVWLAEFVLDERDDV